MQQSTQTYIQIRETNGLGKEALENPRQFNGYLACSLFHSYFSKRNVKKYCEWALENFKEFLLFIVDEPQVWNIFAFKGIPPYQSRESVLKAGSDMMRAFNKTIRGLGTHRISVLRYSDIQNNEQFKDVKKAFYNYTWQLQNSDFVVNESFLADVTSDMKASQSIVSKIAANPILEEGAIWRHSCPGLHEEGDYLVHHVLQRFLLDEISAFVYLEEFGGYPINVAHYPQNSVHFSLYHGKYPQLYSSLGLTGRVGHIKVELV